MELGELAVTTITGFGNVINFISTNNDLAKISRLQDTFKGKKSIILPVAKVVNQVATGVKDITDSIETVIEEKEGLTDENYLGPMQKYLSITNNICQIYSSIESTTKKRELQQQQLEQIRFAKSVHQQTIQYVDNIAKELSMILAGYKVQARHLDFNNKGWSREQTLAIIQKECSCDFSFLDIACMLGQLNPKLDSKQIALLKGELTEFLKLVDKSDALKKSDKDTLLYISAQTFTLSTLYNAHHTLDRGIFLNKVHTAVLSSKAVSNISVAIGAPLLAAGLLCPPVAAVTAGLITSYAIGNEIGMFAIDKLIDRNAVVSLAVDTVDKRVSNLETIKLLNKKCSKLAKKLISLDKEISSFKELLEFTKNLKNSEIKTVIADEIQGVILTLDQQKKLFYSSLKDYEKGQYEIIVNPIKFFSKIDFSIKQLDLELQYMDNVLTRYVADAAQSIQALSEVYRKDTGHRKKTGGCRAYSEHCQLTEMMQQHLDKSLGLDKIKRSLAAESLSVEQILPAIAQSEPLQVKKVCKTNTLGYYTREMNTSINAGKDEPDNLAAKAIRLLL